MKEQSKAVEFIYQDTQIHFLLGNEKNVMVNATEMAKAFNKRTSDFLQNQATKEFISEVELTLKSVNSDVKMYENRGQSGMYFERRLALKFAAWLDVKFDVWIFNIIDEIIFGNAKKVGEKISDAELKKQKIAELIQEVRNSGNETAIALLDNLDELKVIEKEKKKAMALFSNQFKLELN
jgi:hypothetical protein